MQMFNDFVILARDASTDEEEKSLSIFKIIDKFEFSVKSKEFKDAFGVEPTEKVVLPAAFVLCSSWSLENNRKTELSFMLNTTIMSPSGDVLAENKQEVTIPALSNRIRFNVNTQGLPVSGSGRYTIKIEAVDKKEKNYPKVLYVLML
jgi:hypothetical protein